VASLGGEDCRRILIRKDASLESRKIMQKVESFKNRKKRSKRNWAGRSSRDSHTGKGISRIFSTRSRGQKKGAVGKLINPKLTGPPGTAYRLTVNQDYFLGKKGGKACLLL